MRRFLDSNFDKSLELLESFSGEDRNGNKKIDEVSCDISRVSRVIHRQVARGGVVETVDRDFANCIHRLDVGVNEA